MLFIVVKCLFSLSLIINNSTKCFLFNACGDTLASLIRITSLVFSSSLSSSFILWNPPYSKIVIEISRLSFSNCSISWIVGGKLILSVFDCSQRFNNFLDILSKFLLPSSSLKKDIPVAYKKHLPSLFSEFIIAPLLANSFGVGTKRLAEEGFITWNLTYIYYQWTLVYDYLHLLI